MLLDYRFESKRETERVEYSRNPIDEEQRLVSFRFTIRTTPSDLIRIHVWSLIKTRSKDLVSFEFSRGSQRREYLTEDEAFSGSGPRFERTVCMEVDANSSDFRRQSNAGNAKVSRGNPIGLQLPNNWAGTTEEIG